MVRLDEQLQRRVRSITIQELQQLAAGETDAAADKAGAGRSDNGGYQHCGELQSEDAGSLANSSCFGSDAYVTPLWWGLMVSTNRYLLRVVRPDVCDALLLCGNMAFVPR